MKRKKRLSSTWTLATGSSCHSKSCVLSSQSLLPLLSMVSAVLSVASALQPEGSGGMKTLQSTSPVFRNT